MREPRYLRARLFRAAVLILFAVLCGNLFVMQLVRHEHYKDLALENRQLRFRVRAPRGLIRDRDGVILADNQYLAEITLPAACLGEDGPDSTLSRLLEWFRLPREQTLQRLALGKQQGRTRLVLVRGASMPEIAAGEERRFDLPGVRVEAQARRRYLLGPLFAHVVGYVGEVSQEDIDATAEEQIYRRGDMIGKLGIEAAAEDSLRGRHGVKLEEVNASGRIVGSDPVWLQRVVPGSDVTLTLSAALQESLAVALGGAVGCGVALDVVTGEVLAAYSSPTYDPNLLTGSISPAEWERLSNDPAKPFFNRVFQATYPPGSLYKPISSLCALAAEVVGPSSVLDPCYGGYQFGDRIFHCWKRSGHGTLEHGDALVQSCDVFYYQLAQRLDIDQLHAAARAFGLGQPCGTPFPEETGGHVPTAAWYDRRFGRNGWTRGVMLNNIIGQGELLVTPLQMAVLAARLATSGRTPAPTFVQGGPPPAAPPPLPFKEQHLEWVRRNLARVVAEGTGRAAQIAHALVAGKTGTSQNPHGEDHAWFMCYAPADVPRVALAVILENAGHGGVEAAPVAGNWLRGYFHWEAEHGGDALVAAPAAGRSGP
jgi:penicillin-binding protein 2